MTRGDFFTQGVTVIFTKLLDQSGLNDLKSTVNALKAQSMQPSLGILEIRGSIKENRTYVQVKKASAPGQ